jgi:hypothetical protein
MRDKVSVSLIRQIDDGIVLSLWWLRVITLLLRRGKQ